MTAPILTSASPLDAKRPTGVTVLGVLAIVAGVMAIFAGLALMAIGTFAGAAGVAGGSDALGIAGAFGAIAGVLFILYAIFAFAVAWGLFTRKRWAWYATVIMVVLQALGALGSLVGGEFISGLLGLAIAGLVVWYLMRPDVQSWFGVAYKTPWKYGQAPPHA